jgi:Ig-like domain from next to BRCA1 gene
MKLTTNTIIIIFGILVLGIMAIFPISIVAAQVLKPNHDPQATVQAMVTQTTIAMTFNAPTQTPLPSTPITVPVTNTPAPTSTAAPTAITYCDWVAFIKDVTIPDGTTLNPNETFTKTWRLKNIGTCTWTPNYLLVFHSGTQMNGTSMQVPGYVAPGQIIDVAVTFTAPATPGHYIGYWTLQNSSGALFGTGEDANNPFYVDIYVKDLPHGTVTGSLCYPSEFNPPMILYFEKAGTVENIRFAIPENQNTYSVLLPNGKYYAYAWAPGYNLEGAYVDSSLVMKTFIVTGGQTTANINLCDWSPYPHGRGQ